MNKTTLVSAVLLVCLTGLASVSAYGKSQSGFFQTIGRGLPDPTITNDTQRRAVSRDAAIAQAQVEMLALLQNSPSGSGANREDLRSGILQGAYVAKTEWARDGSCRVILRLKKPAKAYFKS